jgi:hypothetical protein
MCVSCVKDKLSPKPESAPSAPQHLRPEPLQVIDASAAR